MNKSAESSRGVKRAPAGGGGAGPAARRKKTQAKPEASFTFLTNHSHVLICLHDEPDARLRDVAARVGITERAVQGIVSDLEAAGALTRHRQGRRNHYEVHGGVALRHAVEAHRTVGDLLAMVSGKRGGSGKGGGGKGG
ncbi:MAG: AsnC family transcriptional regulator [Planctomycetota bacterium]